ncbi:hypothetical protein ACROYT_G015584 [Oculina patagonica]
MNSVILRTKEWPSNKAHGMFPKDPDVTQAPCWETGTNQMHKTIYSHASQHGRNKKNKIYALQKPELPGHE